MVNRWRRYGKDRLYIEDADGAKVGWWDLLTDEGHPESEGDQELLAEAVQRWRADEGRSGAEVEEVLEPAPVDPEPEVVGVETDVPAIPERPWLDLSVNVAGEAARSQAVALRDAAPVRTMVARALGVHTNERAWRIGADGEEKVAAQFERLLKKDPRWQFIHAIPVGSRGSDIDHLVIGPGGVFTVNTKNHPSAKIWVGGDTFMVNGNRQPYVRNARHEAARAAKLLSDACGQPIHVEGLIAVVNAIDVTIKSPSKDVTVVPRRQIATWLSRHGDVLDPERQSMIFDAARRSTTWRD